MVLLYISEPSLFGHDQLESWNYISNLWDQYFGPELFDRKFIHPLQNCTDVLPHNALFVQSYGHSKVERENYKSKIMVNVKHFNPSEVDVRIVDDFIVVHGKHEERIDEHGFIKRAFTRRYEIPEGTDKNCISYSWSINSVLTIKVQMKTKPRLPNERIVPINIATS